MLLVVMAVVMTSSTIQINSKTRPSSFVLVSAQDDLQKEYIQLASKHFHQQFQDRCSKYPFVQKYLDLMKTPPTDKYLLFMYKEKKGGTMVTGGFGDRLAGLTTAITYAIRTNRTLIIHADEPFKRYFRPMTSLDFTETSQNIPNWQDLSWSGWKDEYETDAELLGCVNPSDEKCALDDETVFASTKVLKYYSNRAYLCRWSTKAEVKHRPNIQQLLGNHKENLFEMAGCVLQLAMQPTEALWKAHSNLLFDFLQQDGQKILEQSWKHDSLYQIGIHFRSGDLKTFNNRGRVSNSLVHHLSPDTTSHVSKCASHVLQEKVSSSPSTSTLLYIESDNSEAIKDMVQRTEYNHTLHPANACHIDSASSHMTSSISSDTNADTCGLATLSRWFTLAKSQAIVTQFRVEPQSDRHMTVAKTASPMSAFSRFAAIYGLNAHNMRHGDPCKPVDANSISQQTHGNWICDPRVFY